MMIAKFNGGAVPMQIFREHPIHLAIKKYLDLQSNLYYFHPANGEARSERTGAKLKMMGVKPGVADFVVIKSKWRGVPGHSVAIPYLATILIFLEVKPPGRYQTKSQKEFQKQVEKHGCQYHVVRSIDDVKKIVKGD